MPVGIRIAAKSLQQASAQMQALFASLTQDAGSRTELHRRYGIQAMNWILENFQREGGLLEDGPWQKLSENTIAGRRKGSSRILQNTGILRASFQPQVTSTEVRVGSALKVALWQNEGTKGPYPIVPKNALALAFPSANPNKKVRYSFSSIATRRTYKRGQELLIVKKVMHPGLVARRMLPRESELLPRLLRATNTWLRGNSRLEVTGGETE